MACVVVVLLTIGASVFYGAWWAVCQVPHGILAACFLIAMALSPVVGYGAYRAAKLGYKLGKTESNGVIAGIGLGTGPVVETAEKVARVKAGAARAMRQEPWAVNLPQMVDVTPRRLPSGDDQVVM